MAATDLVPCFYTGQDYRYEPPAEVHTRREVREFKTRGLGKFVDSGKIFLFFKQLAKKLWDGPLGIGNLLPFAKPHNYGDKLHYETPMAGDRTAFARHRRHLIHVSGRSRWSVQILPNLFRSSARSLEPIAVPMRPTQLLASGLLAENSL